MSPLAPIVMLAALAAAAPARMPHPGPVLVTPGRGTEGGWEPAR